MKLIESDRLYFRWVEEKDITDKYISWMNDKEINQYMETWHYPHSEENIRGFVRQHFEKRDEPFFAIMLKEHSQRAQIHNSSNPSLSASYLPSDYEKPDRHIGNIKLGPINWIHRYADVSLFIGEKDLQGQGYGSEAIKLISDYALYTLNLHKICAGIYFCNYASRKAFGKAGFIPDGQRRNHVNWKGQYIDVLYYARWRD